MPETISVPEKSLIVQILNEVDEFSPEEKKFILYWLRTQKNKGLAAKADMSVKPNDLSIEDVYAERDAMRKEKAR